MHDVTDSTIKCVQIYFGITSMFYLDFTCILLSFTKSDAMTHRSKKTEYMYFV